MSALLEVEDLRVHIPASRGALRRPRRAVHAVDGVNLTVDEGETVGLVGESGSGKTTLARTLLRVNRPTTGSIRLDGVETSSLTGSRARTMRRRVQMVFQDPYSSLHPRLRVRHIVAEPLHVHRIGTRASRGERVAELLHAVGLSPEYGDRYPRELSGGERQRVGIARALALDPDLVVADEPLSALDVSIQAEIVGLLQRLQDDRGIAYLLIAHDLAIVRQIAHRVAVMYLGRLVEVGTVDAVFERPLHPYTTGLLSAIPVPDPVTEAQRPHVVLPGDPPDPAAPPTGCPFRARCWLHRELGSPAACYEAPPVLDGAGTDHQSACHFADRCG